MLVYIFALLLPFSIYATVFVSQPVSQQVSEADGIIIGNYLRKEYIQLENGSVVTQMIFKMIKEVGTQSELLGTDEIIVHYPGGKAQDQYVQVEGVPEFLPGENVVIMIKSHEDRYWGMNLAFGTFRIINYGKHRLIVNSVFPNDTSAGQMRMDTFEKLVTNLKGSRFKVVQSTDEYPTEMNNKIDGVRSPASFSEGKIRTIASVPDEGENNLGSRISTWWLIMILAALGGIYRLIRQKAAR